MAGYFITGTDTEIGKTWASVALIHALRAQGLQIAAMKPVAAGLDEPSDASLLLAACSQAVDLSLLNPLRFSLPASPHLAASQEQRQVTLPPLLEAYAALAASADRVIVEGVGGWMVPLSDQLMLPQLVQALELPVILVVGLKLGCLNHALLSAEKIQADGFLLAGWIGNVVDPDMLLLEQNVATLKKLIDAPLLGVIPKVLDPSQGAAYLNTQLLQA